MITGCPPNHSGQPPGRPYRSNPLMSEALKARIQDDVKAAMPLIATFAGFEKHHDGDTAAYIFALGAIWSQRVMEDPGGAKRYAQKGLDIGHSNDRIISTLEQIVGE